MSDILEGLNPEQLEAVTLPLHSAEGEALSALVLAGAGSGKTRVLTTRIAWLIMNGHASPHGILAVTFTNKAAREMLTRISGMLPINTRGMWVGTFHGLCNRMLRAHWQEAALPQQFQILDTQDQLAAVKRLLKGLNADDERFPPREVQWYINGQKDAGLRARQVAPYDEYTRRCAEFYAAYEEQCQREGVVDFAELLLRSHELLQRNEPLREHYQARFRHILVDEFQDTSPLQYQWLKLLSGGRNAVFAVGDDDQSIYAFRGATVRNMEDFRRDFPTHRLVKLEQNYRSHGNILDAANALIRNNRGRLGKNLWTTDDRGEPLRVYESATDLDEASFIVEEAKTLQAEGVRLSDIAVLYRSNAQSRVLEHALFSAALPYRVYGGLRFFERQEVKHALAYLRLASSPEDDNAFLRVVNVPARGIGARTLEQLQEEAKAQGGSLWQAALRRAAAGGQRAPEGGKGVPGFVALIQSLRSGVEGLPLPEAVEHVVARSGLIEMYRAEREGADRIENLGELVTAAAGFVMEAEDDSLVAFLTHAALEAGEHQAAGGAEALQLMTAHSAKGLEFHSVFVTGLEEGLFPHENSVNAGDGLEEERRLMYVALTRARRRLYLTYAQCRMLHGQTRYNMASRFLQELPEALLKWLGPGRPGSSGLADRVSMIAQRAADRGFPRSGTGRGAVAAPALESTAASSGWRVGQNVAHSRFGAGVIVSCEGHGADARVQVRFSSGAVKWLALEYAKLTPA
ncbi:MAG TPA: UvrD-helicase domain-containing protein [Burkholderiales bacterium]|nr:UvrD-helicase domain-containing protein [Burkholderiales bacterium]